jgi:hypothetical protein
MNIKWLLFIFCFIGLFIIITGCPVKTQEFEIPVSAVYYKEITSYDDAYGGSTHNLVTIYFLGVICDSSHVLGTYNDSTPLSSLITSVDSNEITWRGGGEYLITFMSTMTVRLRDPFVPAVDFDKKLHFDTSTKIKYRTTSNFGNTDYLGHISTTEKLIDYSK